MGFRVGVWGFGGLGLAFGVQRFGLEGFQSGLRASSGFANFDAETKTMNLGGPACCGVP